ncbi:MAG: purine-binding chemotaxis protein CheW [Cyclobacteriaceae bacterium]|jgi:purine-binding chemotaxis protein CheW
MSLDKVDDLVDNWAEFASKTKLKHLQRSEKIEKATLVVFNLFDHEYALVIDEIKEIISIPHITPIPQTPDYIVGLGNVRGNVLALLDLNYRVFKESSGKNEFVVVLKSNELKLGLLVTKMPETFTLEKSMLNYSSTAIKSLSKEDDFIKGLVKKDERIIFLMDTKKL